MTAHLAGIYAQTRTANGTKHNSYILMTRAIVMYAEARQYMQNKTINPA
jgi:hypothetical protein